MVNWSPSSDPHHDSKRVKQCQLSYGLPEYLLKNSRYVQLDLSAMAGETMLSFWELEPGRAHRLLADSVLDESMMMENSQDIPGNCSKYCLLLPNESYVAGLLGMARQGLFGQVITFVWATSCHMSMSNTQLPCVFDMED